MTRRDLPTRVPCGVCLQYINGWVDLPDERQAAVPCGHTLEQIARVGQRMQPIQEGQCIDQEVPR